MAPFKVMIADDEPLARQGLRDFLARQPDTVLVAECADGLEAIQAIADTEPDLVFLDVQMPQVDGFGVIAAVGAARMPAVIFVTAYDHYACRAFEICAIDYVLKPAESSRLQQAFHRALRSADAPTLRRIRETLARLEEFRDAERARGLLAENQPPALERLAVTTGGRVEFVEIDELHWIEAEANYARVHSRGRSFLIRATLDSLHQQLGISRFVRIRRSILVRARAISAIEPLTKGAFVLVLHDGTRLTSSRHFRKNLDRVIQSGT